MYVQLVLFYADIITQDNDNVGHELPFQILNLARKRPKKGKFIPDNSVVMGSPGKVVKTLDEQGAARLHLSALHYAEHYKNFLALEEFSFE